MLIWFNKVNLINWKRLIDSFIVIKGKIRVIIRQKLQPFGWWTHSTSD